MLASQQVFEEIQDARDHNIKKLLKDSLSTLFKISSKLIIFFYFITIGDFSNNQQLSLLAMLGYSFFKILPTLQGIFTQTVVYNSHKNSVNEIYSKLTSIQENYIDCWSDIEKNFSY